MGSSNFRAGQRKLAPGPTHQHRVHSWKVLAPAHLLTRELLPHETGQSQDLCDKYSLLLSHCELPSFGWPFFLPGAGVDLMGFRLVYSPETPYPGEQPPSAVRSTHTWRSLGKRGWAHTYPGPPLCHCPVPKKELSIWHGMDPTLLPLTPQRIPFLLVEALNNSFEIHNGSSSSICPEAALGNLVPPLSPL